jgi:hypothetical protein
MTTPRTRTWTLLALLAAAGGCGNPATPPPAVSSGGPPAGGMAPGPAGTDGDRPTTVGTGSAQGPSPGWSTGRQVTHDGVTVQVNEIRMIPAAGGEEEGPSAILVIDLSVANTTDLRIGFDGWQLNPKAPKARLTIDHKTDLPMTPYSGLPANNAGPKEIKAKGVLEHHYLAFALQEFNPGPTTAFFLELPGEPVGAKVPFRFEIPVRSARTVAPAGVGGPAAGTTADENPDNAKATAALNIARRLLEAGDPEGARDKLNDLVKRYPNAPAAQEAKRILKNLK